MILYFQLFEFGPFASLAKTCTSVLHIKGFLQYNSYIRLKVKLGREEWGPFFSFPRNECDSLLGLMGVFPSNKVQWNSQMSEPNGRPACNYCWVTLSLPDLPFIYCRIIKFAKNWQSHFCTWFFQLLKKNCFKNSLLFKGK